jgi:osmoprotectant transport system ATP-binding protein
VQEAFELGGRICLMDKGKVMQIGTPAELLFHPANDFVKNFLADAQMQLAFMITRVSDLWPYLRPGSDEASPYPVIESNASLWNIMDEMTSQNQAQFSLHNGEKAINISMADLLQAFTAYKKHL